ARRLARCAVFVCGLVGGTTALQARRERERTGSRYEFDRRTCSGLPGVSVVVGFPAAAPAVVGTPAGLGNRLCGGGGILHAVFGGNLVGDVESSRLDGRSTCRRAAQWLVDDRTAGIRRPVSDRSAA